MKGKMNIMKQKPYHFDTNFYAIEIAETYANQNEASKAKYRFYSKLKRIQQNSKYSGISFGIGISNQDGQTATKIEVRNGKRGRPRIHITSRQTKDWHIHCVVYGKMASSFCQEFIEYFRKHNCSNIRKHCLASGDRKGADYVPYCYNQCIKWLTYGKYDFSVLYNALAWKEDTTEECRILSHKKTAVLTEKTLATLELSDFRTLYVIIFMFVSHMSFQRRNTSIEYVENSSGRTHYTWVRSICHARNRLRLSYLCIEAILPRQTEDYRWHTARPLTSARFSNGRSLLQVHHTFAVNPCRYV